MSGIEVGRVVSAPKSVDQYIRAAPRETQAALRRVRAAIQAAAPNVDESISYGLPFYRYKGEAGIEGRLCYFGVRGAGLQLYLRPKDLEPHAQRIAKYRTAKSALRFPLDEPIPFRLIQTLVREAERRHRAGNAG